ncbi:hypothetical protein PSACC_03454 [Paramicrosporidium saccamoebae]|uniref:Uncharacterized protein n=1 Tax=Paramicrosporidium saccamoebae TaxID=1246581 RepID=A0A2H9TG41_9FUNG|nr:hypothetical protein PSACC_03454 [Paramicrosporidium saccamoebae]
MASMAYSTWNRRPANVNYLMTRRHTLWRECGSFRVVSTGLNYTGGFGRIAAEREFGNVQCVELLQMDISPASITSLLKTLERESAQSKLATIGTYE